MEQMVEEDVAFIRRCLAAKVIQSPCLELGVGYCGHNNKQLIQNAGIEYLGTDLVASEAVDVCVNFEDSSVSVEAALGRARYGSVLVLNVLEHTFDPIRVLDNVFNVLRPCGTCIIVTPTIWPLHDFPFDCWRINPNFYEEYCKRRSLVLLEEYFEYIGRHKVKASVDSSGTYVLPAPSLSKIKMFRSRVIHKLFNTVGRGMMFPSYVATGVVIRKAEG
jgi:SAM-dependent methyltransferase